MSERRALLHASLFLLAVAIGFILLVGPYAFADGGMAAVDAGISEPVPLSGVIEAAPSAWDEFFTGKLFAVLGGVALMALGFWKWLDASRKALVLKLSQSAFLIAEDLGKAHKGPDPFDKAATALKAFVDLMKAGGWGEPSLNETEMAKLQLKAINGQGILAKQLAAINPK